MNNTKKKDIFFYLFARMNVKYAGESVTLYNICVELYLPVFRTSKYLYLYSLPTVIMYVKIKLTKLSISTNRWPAL